VSPSLHKKLNDLRIAQRQSRDQSIRTITKFKGPRRAGTSAVLVPRFYAPVKMDILI
jgi:hypothetical protein